MKILHIRAMKHLVKLKFFLTIKEVYDYGNVLAEYISAFRSVAVCWRNFISLRFIDFVVNLVFDIE